MLISSKEFLDIQCRFTLKRICNMIRTHSQCLCFDVCKNMFFYYLFSFFLSGTVARALNKLANCSCKFTQCALGYQPLSKTPSPLLQQAPPPTPRSANCPIPPFSVNSPIYCFFANPLLKIGFFSESP